MFAYSLSFCCEHMNASTQLWETVISIFHYFVKFCKTISRLLNKEQSSLVVALPNANNQYF